MVRLTWRAVSVLADREKGHESLRATRRPLSNNCACGVFVSARMKKRIRTPLQCAGQTRAGKRCSITDDCNMKDANGAFIAEPLKNGASHCKLHLRIFCARPARVDDPLLLYLDFKTTTSCANTSSR